MTHKGTPAPYNGTLFRSHLEARWAIFFDHLDLKWEYEAQGFDVDGTWYLPDFAVFAASGLLWVEIKPEWDTDPGGVEKWHRFAPQRPQPSRAVLLTGKPSVLGTHTVIGGDEDANSPVKGPWEDDTQQWRPCPSGHHFGMAHAETFKSTFADDGCPDEFGRGGDERIEFAVRAALHHRFGRFQPPPTHGEAA